MNRMEEALRRAHRETRMPEAFAAPDAGALDTFRATDAPEFDARVFGEEFPSEETAAAIEPEARSGHAESAPVAVLPSTLSLPHAIGAPGAGRSTHRTWDGKLVTDAEVKSVTVEQYRHLAATLHQAQCNDGIKVVMVASALAGEGKTLTAVNLALTLSESYARRVLLIDADLRRPMVHQVFQVPNASGLNDGLMGDADRKLTVLEISPRLSLLPAGRPDRDPMSALTSDRMRRVIQEAATKFDWVVLDTAPVALLPDAHLLAAMVHVAVLVVQAGRTPCDLINRAIESLGRKRVIGVVLNRADDRAMSTSGKYEQYYASSSYGRDSNLPAST